MSMQKKKRQVYCTDSHAYKRALHSEVLAGAHLAVLHSLILFVDGREEQGQQSVHIFSYGR